MKTRLNIPKGQSEAGKKGNQSEKIKLCLITHYESKSRHESEKPCYYPRATIPCYIALLIHKENYSSLIIFMCTI